MALLFEALAKAITPKPQENQLKTTFQQLRFKDSRPWITCRNHAIQSSFRGRISQAYKHIIENFLHVNLEYPRAAGKWNSSS
ncbi:hypothetical protein RB195_001091 [Necator americanus]|uniref:Uncharacterized protein n=1 Tax=Necator americanus TaxID=51031 RepID=A0ABR1DCP1_NECAM